jgi:arsenate reductase (thioredoxin)
VSPRYNFFMSSGPKFRVLFVCLGNACRSPMAEAIARKLAPDVIEPSSAGLSPLGHLAEGTEQTLRANGYPFAYIASKPLRPNTFENADIVINMSGRSLAGFFPEGHSTGDPLPRRKIKNWNVEDPYGEDPATYQRILEELESKVLMLAAQLRSAPQDNS